MESLPDRGVYEDGAGLVLLLISEKGNGGSGNDRCTKGAGGRFAGSVSWGIEAQLSIHRPLGGLGRMARLAKLDISTSSPRTNADASPTSKTKGRNDNIFRQQYLCTNYPLT